MTAAAAGLRWRSRAILALGAVVLLVDLLVLAWLWIQRGSQQNQRQSRVDAFTVGDALTVMHVTHRHRLDVFVGPGEHVPSEMLARWRALADAGIRVHTGPGQDQDLALARDQVLGQGSVAVSDALSLAVGGTGTGDLVVTVIPTDRHGEAAVKVLLVLAPFRPGVPQSLDVASTGVEVTVSGPLEARLLETLSWTAAWPAGRVRARVLPPSPDRSRVDAMIDALLADVASDEADEAVKAFKAVALWVSPTHPALRRLARAQLVLLTYDDGTALDPTRLALAAPLARSSTHDTRLLLPASQGARRFVKLLTASALLFSSDDIDAHPLLRVILRTTVTSGRATDAVVAENNQLAMHLPLCATTAAFLAHRNGAVARRTADGDGHDANGPPLSTSEIPVLAVLEQMDETQQQTSSAGRVQLAPAGPVRGRLVRSAPGGAQRVFEPASRWIGGVRLRPGDRVTLAAQPAAAENGLYIVAHDPDPDSGPDGPDGPDGPRGTDGPDGPLRLFTALDMLYDARTFEGRAADAAPSADSRDLLLDTGDAPPGLLQVAAADVARRWPGVALSSGDVLWLRNVGQLATVEGVDAVDGGLVRLRLADVRPDSVTSDKFGATATCITDPRVMIQQLCEWGDGQARQSGQSGAQPTGVWDHRCVDDADCPFYQANRTYPNVRGGCSTNGLCEMPVGVKRVGFRKYTGQPACHGCAPSAASDDAMAACCEARRAAAGAPTPDYAF
jgi:hypothetical protein